LETICEYNSSYSFYYISAKNEICLQVLQQLKEKALVRAGLTEVQVLGKIEERTSARKQKQYQRSDEIRRELEVLGIALMDNPDGTTWLPAIPLQVQEVQAASS
jgi:cysteinyl-tRNA synthetase